MILIDKKSCDYARIIKSVLDIPLWLLGFPIINNQISDYCDCDCGYSTVVIGIMILALWLAYSDHQQIDSFYIHTKMVKPQPNNDHKPILDMLSNYGW